MLQNRDEMCRTNERKGVAPLLSRWSRVARQSNKASITGIFPGANSAKSAPNMKGDNATHAIQLRFWHLHLLIPLTYGVPTV